MGSKGSALAEDNTCYNCCCNNGMTVPGVDCTLSCESAGGVKSWSGIYYCGGEVPEVSCTAVNSGAGNDSDVNAINDGLTDACGGACDSSLGAYCNESTGSCEYGSSSSGVCDPACGEGETCTANGCMPSSSSDNTLPGSNSNDTKSSGSPGSASLPNFVGVSSISELILKITKFLIALAIPFAVLMLIWAGFQFATAQGSEEKLRTAKRNLVWTIAGIAVIMASNAIIGYITEILGGGTGEGNALITTIKDTLNQIIGVLFILVTVYFFWGIVEFVRSSGSGDAAKLETGKKHMVWGIIGMAIMASAWGIVAMIQQAFQ